MYVYVSLSLYIYIYMHTHLAVDAGDALEGHEGPPVQHEVPRLRTNGVNTTGAAAKVMNFDRLSGTKIRPGIFGNIKVG